MRIEDLKREMQRRLAPEYGEGEARAMTGLVFLALKGWSATDLAIHALDEASDYLVGKCGETLVRLERGEPIQYVLGVARFHGLDLQMGPGALIPRPETAELVDMIVDSCGQRRDLRVLDLCTGSGAIAVALARSLPFARVTALELSEEALAWARRNDEALKTHVELVRADIFKWIPGRGDYDVMVSNPPYVLESERKGMERNVLEHEPAEALFVPDGDPLLYYRRIAEIAGEGLAPGGSLWLECNPLTVRDIPGMLEDHGLRDVETRRDSFGKLRFVSARKP